MSATLHVELGSVGIERAAAEAAVVFHFAGDRPLRGAAGRADWRLCGALSEWLAAGMADTEPGAALLVPTAGRLRAGRLLLLGLGDPARFEPQACARAVAGAARRVLDLGLGSLALSPPGDWLDRIPVGIGAQACLRGAVAALEGREAALLLRILAPRERVARVLRGLDAAAADLRDGPVGLRLPEPPRLDPRPRAPGRRPPAPPPQP